MNILYIIIAGLGVLLGFSVTHNVKEKKRLEENESLYTSEKKKGAENAKAQEEAQRAKQDAKSGDHSRDSDFIANRLHELATRGTDTADD